MGKSKKQKFNLETEAEVQNDESLIEENQVSKIKSKKKNKTSLPPENSKIKKEKKTVESPMEDDVVAEIGSVSEKKSKKRKRKLVESVSPSLEEATDSNDLANENEDVEESESGSKAKKRKLKKSNSNIENISHESKKTEPKQNLQKKSKKNDESCSESKDSRDSRTIFIGNLPVTYNKKALVKLLKEKGNFTKSWTRGFIPRSDKISKKTAAIAKLLPDDQPPLMVYALFETAADAKNALTLNGAIFEDHRLRVTLAVKKQSPPEYGVFVGNLPLNITDDDLYDFFNQCGKIVSTRVVRTKEGKGRGIAFVNFESVDSVELALKLNEEKLRDREIRVSRLKNQGQLDKMRKRQALRATKDALSNKKPRPKKTESSPDKSDKFQKKKKKLNSVEFKKKVLAEKLTNTTKRKEKKSE